MSSSNPSSNSSNPSAPSSNNGPTAAGSTTPEQTQHQEQIQQQQEQPLDINNIPTPQTIEEAMDTLNKLQAMKDSLLEEKKRNDSYMKRYTEKVAKCERMATLHQLIPRQLFVREDAYQRELEKVAQWSGISDQEIADIYQRKLGDINKKFRHHGAASSSNVGVTNEERRDPYAGFRDVPDFSKVNGKSLSSFNNNNTNAILRNLEFMKKIASGGGGGNN
jgi:hypothetical protein